MNFVKELGNYVHGQKNMLDGAGPAQTSVQYTFSLSLRLRIAYVIDGYMITLNPGNFGPSFQHFLQFWKPFILYNSLDCLQATDK
jgi:hypothetical protein